MESRNKNKEQKKSCVVVGVSSQDKHMNYASEKRLLKLENQQLFLLVTGFTDDSFSFPAAQSQTGSTLCESRRGTLHHVNL